MFRISPPEDGFGLILLMLADSTDCKAIDFESYSILKNVESMKCAGLAEVGAVLEKLLKAIFIHHEVSFRRILKLIENSYVGLPKSRRKKDKE